MAKVKVVIESDEGINVKVTKQTENAGLEKLKADLEQTNAECEESQGGKYATENT